MARETDTLIHTVKTFSNDTIMEFVIRKCAILILAGGEIVNCDGYVMLENEIMKVLDEVW